MDYKCIKWLSCASLLLGSIGQAAPKTVTTLPSDYDNFRPKSQLEAQVYQSQYLSEASGETQPESVSSIGVRWKAYSSEKASFPYGFDGQSLFSQGESDRPYVSVPELYAGYESPFSLSFYFGRKLQEWSRMDQQWRLGIWQPHARWDYIHPQTQGLTGAFVDHQHQWGSIHLFISPFFLPDQGPQFELEDGRFVSRNRWFWEPQAEVGLFADSSQIYYELDRPSEQDIVVNPSLATRLEFGDAENGSWAKTSYAYKPMNQLHLGVEGKVLIADVGRVRATIHPGVVYHHVSTIETGYRSDDHDFWVSLTHDYPEKSDMPEEWLHSELREMYFASTGYAHRLHVGSWRSMWLRYSYMKTWLGRDLNKSNILGGSVDSSLDRFPLSDVASVEWTHQLVRSVRRGVRLGFKYLYSLPEDGSLLSSSFQFQSSRQLIWELSFDVLGSEQSAEEAGSGLMTRYRSNDRIVGGVTYVF